MILCDKSQGEWVFLKNVAEGYELDLITLMLVQINIPVQKKSKGSGAYTSIYMGMSLTGYDIYVPADRLLEAQEMLAGTELMETEYIEEAGMETNEPGGYIMRYRELFKKLFIIFFIIPGMIAFLYFVLLNLKNLL